MAKKRDKQETPDEPEEVVDDLEQEEDEGELDDPEIDPDLDEEDLADPELDEDDEFVEIDGDFVDEEESEEDTGGPVRRSVASKDEDEDEDDELLAPDDVEADLDTILKDRMVAADEDDEDDEEPEERGEAADRLQPKRADERLCPSCFLLVRHGAPVCPVGDDDCPLVK